MANVPCGTDAFHSHQQDAAHGAANQEGTAEGGGETEDIPELTVASKLGGNGEALGDVEDVNAADECGDVAEDGGEPAHDDSDDVGVSPRFQNPAIQFRKQSRLGQCSEHETDADEVEDVLQVGILQRLRETFLHHGVAAEQGAVAEFVHNPDECQHTECAQRRGEECDAVESRDEPQSADADKEQEQALRASQQRVVAAIGRVSLCKLNA